MTRAVIAAICVIGCGSARPRVANEDDDDHPRTIFVPEPEPTASAERPTLDLAQLLPDPTERGRWPLGMATHPILEPHFDVGGALAAPGVGWLDLCGRGIQNRHLAGNQDPVEYLRAWCSAQNHNTTDAIARLAGLRNSVVPGIRESLWIDVANILADNGDASDAMKVIDRNHLEHDVDLLDILAATYVEVGKRGDAIELDRLANEADHTTTPDRACNRFARLIVIAETDLQQKTLSELHKRIGSYPLQACAPIEHELQCWLYPERCDEYFIDHGIDNHYSDVFWSYEHWPFNNTATSFVWWRLGVSASHAIGIRGADELAVIALDASFRSSACDPQRLADLRKALDGIRNDPKRDRRLDARVDALIVRLEHLAHAALDTCKRELANR